MAKKQVAVSLRKPPPPADFDRFVAGGDKPEAPAEAPRATEGPVVTTRVGDRREVTIYLPQELARKLSVRCVELDRDMSNVIAEALSKTLEDPSPELEPVVVPIDRWERARALLAEWRTRIPARFRFGLV
jgi:hypothetical protein